jgi:hypothetical protein
VNPIERRKRADRERVVASRIPAGGAEYTGSPEGEIMVASSAIRLACSTILVRGGERPHCRLLRKPGLPVTEQPARGCDREQETL